MGISEVSMHFKHFENTALMLYYLIMYVFVCFVLFLLILSNNSLIYYLGEDLTTKLIILMKKTFTG